MPTLRWLLCAAAVVATPIGVRADTVRALVDVKVHAGLDVASDVLLIIKAGSILDVTPQQEGWLALLLPADTTVWKLIGDEFKDNRYERAECS